MARKRANVEATVDDLLSNVSFRGSEPAHIVRMSTSAIRYRKPENINGIAVELTTSSTAEVTIPHLLGRIPSLVLVGCPTAAVSYTQSTTANATNIYITPSAVTECTVKILIL